MDDLKPLLQARWEAIREELLSDTYRPSPVRKVEIPKPGGKGVRMLGIPTVLDRLIQQALHQVLQRYFDPRFSDASFGFRPRRSAHQAIDRRGSTSRPGIAGWWTWTWRSSLIGSTMTS